MPWLEVKEVGHAYKSATVLKEINLSVGEGEVVCLLGSSGCGKSTLLRLIAGLEPLEKGEIYINKKPASRPGFTMPATERNVGMVFQHPSLFPHLNVMDNTTFGLKHGAKKRAAKTAETIATRRLNAVGMKTLGERYPHELSGGQQQRVALARALSPNPKVMLLDEPFANLDITLRRTIREETMKLLRSLNVATLLVTHDPEEALQVADRIYVMQEGRIIQEGTPKELYQKPRNAFVARVFGQLNAVDVVVKNQKAETPFGTLNVEKVACQNVGKEYCEPLKDGMKATLYIRPEALTLATEKTAHTSATVEQVFFLGMTSVIHIRLKESHTILRMRTSRSTIPEIGEKVPIRLKEEQVFIFSS